jgi:hypothetical protein
MGGGGGLSRSLAPAPVRGLWDSAEGPAAAELVESLSGVPRLSEGARAHRLSTDSAGREGRSTPNTPVGQPTPRR